MVANGSGLGADWLRWLAMVQCPACKDYDIHQSQWSGVLERIAMMPILRRPVRCYSCFHRFHTWIFAGVKPRGTRYVPKQKKASA